MAEQTFKLLCGHALNSDNRLEKEGKQRTYLVQFIEETLQRQKASNNYVNK